MSTRTPPPIATWLLELSGTDEFLIGDLAEAYQAHPSRAWYWREVLIASSLSLAARISAQKIRAIRLAITSAAAVWFFSFAVIGGQTIDLATAIQVEALSTGWMTAAFAHGQSKLVPTVSFTLKNISGQPLSNLNVNAVFHRNDDPDEWGNRFQPSVAPNGLGPGAATPTVTIASPLGYTSLDARPDMLKHSQFVDATVTLFGKYGAGEWTRLGDYAISRQLITP
jgi:hypothetical protein